MAAGAWRGARLSIVAGLAGLAWTTAAFAEQPAALATGEIERIVREYLMREPEVIYDALQELQRRQAAEAADRQRLALIHNRDALVADPDAPTAGAADGDVTLVEFFDYRCTYCRRVVGSLQALLEEDQNLRVVFKELPVLGDESVRAARAALAAKNQDGYVRFHFALMKADDLSEQSILALAEAQGLNTGRLLQDMNSEEVDRAINANYALADALGIEGTPAFVIGDQLVPGAVPKARLEELIEQARSS